MSRAFGNTGEEIAVQFLQKKQFKILERNIHFKTGEIDVVARNIKTGRVHLIEVKTVSGSPGISRITPLENMTHKKMQRIQTTAQLYVSAKSISDWCIDVIFIWIDSDKQKTHIQHVGNFC